MGKPVGGVFCRQLLSSCSKQSELRVFFLQGLVPSFAHFWAGGQRHRDFQRRGAGMARAHQLILTWLLETLVSLFPKTQRWRCHSLGTVAFQLFRESLLLVVLTHPCSPCPAHTDVRSRAVPRPCSLRALAGHVSLLEAEQPLGFQLAFVGPHSFRSFSFLCPGFSSIKSSLSHSPRKGHRPCVEQGRRCCLGSRSPSDTHPSP